MEAGLGTLPDHQHPFACIALLDGNHFAIAADVDKDGVKVIDPPRSYRLPRPTFESRWDGRALLLSPQPVEVIPGRRVWPYAVAAFVALVAGSVGVAIARSHKKPVV